MSLLKIKYFASFKSKGGVTFFSYVFICFLFVPTLLSTSEVLAQGEPGSRTDPGMYGCAYGLSWLGHIIMVVLWIAILVGVIFLITLILHGNRAIK